MKKISITAMIVMWICIPLTAEGQEDPWLGFLEAGDRETDIMLGLDFTEYDGSVDGGNWYGPDIQIGVGRFITHQFSTGMRLGGALSIDKETETYRFNAGGYCKYHFFEDEESVIPYVGGQAGFMHLQFQHEHRSTDDEWGIYYGPILGVKFFEYSNTSFILEYQLRFFTADIEDILDLEHSVFFGISLNY